MDEHVFSLFLVSCKIMNKFQVADSSLVQEKNRRIKKIHVQRTHNAFEGEQKHVHRIDLI